MLKSISVCHQGIVRERNEDALAGNEELGLWVVADGVGGNSHGDVASQLAVQTIERRIRQGCGLDESIIEANKAIVSAQQAQETMRNMASTVVACLFHGNQFELSWVGDSRAYLIDEEGIHQLSEDHNLANELYHRGQISRESLRKHSGQHELTQALGQMSLTEVPKCLGEMHDGDMLLLCTDGLSGPLTDEQILNTLLMSTDIEASKESLLKQVLDAGAPDNVSFVLLEYQVEAELMQSKDFDTSRKSKVVKVVKDKLEGSLRHPFNKTAYRKHLSSRNTLLLLMLAAILFLVFFI